MILMRYTKEYSTVKNNTLPDLCLRWCCPQWSGPLPRAQEVLAKEVHQRGCGRRKANVPSRREGHDLRGGEEEVLDDYILLWNKVYLMTRVLKKVLAQSTRQSVEKVPQSLKNLQQGHFAWNCMLIGKYFSDALVKSWQGLRSTWPSATLCTGSSKFEIKLKWAQRSHCSYAR